MGKPAGATPKGEVHAHRRQAWGAAPGVSSIPPKGCRGPGHVEVWTLVPRPDCRRFVCDRCGRADYICSWCDRGQRYCSAACREAARRHSLREAGRRYQRTRRGRRLHARRQQAYRERQREKVTHHGCRAAEESARVAACTREPVKLRRSVLTAPRRRRKLHCVACGEPCEAVIRHDFLRCRRPWRARGGPPHDLQAAGGRDPSLG